MENLLHFLLFMLSAFFSAFFADCQPFIGINYGEIADNLPPPQSTARLLQSTTISRVRLYGVDASIIRSLAGSSISLVVGTSNGEIPSLAGNPAVASAWIAANIVPFIQSTSISIISVGNEVLTAGDPALSSQLLPAMKNLRSAAPPGIKISTVHSMEVLSQSDPPSSGAFNSDISSSLHPILQFLHDNESPFMVNPYPYFAYKSDPRAETLAFCLFQPNSGRLDSGSGITYTNMFDAQLAAIRAALRSAGFSGEAVLVAETGWPHNGDAGEVGANVENAKAYNSNLVAHLKTLPDPVETYLFALYDEDLKPGPTSERSFGLFRPDLTEIYDAGLIKTEVKTGQVLTPSPAPAETVNSSHSTASPPPPTPPVKGALVMAPPPPANGILQNLPNNVQSNDAGSRAVVMLNIFLFVLLCSSEAFDFMMF